jgi:hypothetical protein
MEANALVQIGDEERFRVMPKIERCVLCLPFLRCSTLFIPENFENACRILWWFQFNGTGEALSSKKNVVYNKWVK